MEEIKEKLQEAENEISLLKELVIKGFKGIEKLSLQSETKFPGGSASAAAEHSETNKSEMMSTDANNGLESQTELELPLPVPNLF